MDVCGVGKVCVIEAKAEETLLNSFRPPPANDDTLRDIMVVSSVTGEGREAGLVTIVLECALATFTQRAVGFCCNVRCDKMEYGREIGHDVSRVCGVCVWRGSTAP